MIFVHYTIEHYERRYRVGRSVCTPANAPPRKTASRAHMRQSRNEAEKRRAQKLSCTVAASAGVHNERPAPN
jgi:hypothetical protein